MAEPCDKTAYSETLARREARRLSDNSGESFRAYVCTTCGRWHLTTQGPSRPIAKKQPEPRHWPTRPRRAHTAAEMEELAAKMRAERSGQVSDG